MAPAPKKTAKDDLEKIATQLAAIKILPVAEDDHISVRVTAATFATKTFTARKYQVAVGIDQALLRLDHPGFERERPYQSTLDKNVWSQSSTNRTFSKTGGVVKATIGKTFSRLLGASIGGHFERNKQKSVQQNTAAPYPLITAMPTGWRIGTELGDPRAPEGTLPDGLEHCLSGEYFSGRRDELGEGHKGKNRALALCVLRPKVGGNDPTVTATLFGASGSLRVAVTLIEPIPTAQHSSLQLPAESRSQEDQLREAFIKICLRRVEEAYVEGLPRDAIVSREFYLSTDHKHAPKVSPTANSEKPENTKGNRDG